MAIDALSGIGARFCRVDPVRIFFADASPCNSIRTGDTLYRRFVYRHICCMCNRVGSGRYRYALFFLRTYGHHSADSGRGSRNHGNVYLVCAIDREENQTERAAVNAGSVESIDRFRCRSIDHLHYQDYFDDRIYWWNHPGSPLVS